MYELRWYQAEAVDAAMVAMRRGENPCVVLPTGAGKSIVIAELCRLVHEKGRRVVVLQHRKELIRQNAEKIQSLIPDANVTIFSAGLKSKDASGEIVVAGIQSVYKHAHEVGDCALVIVDEGHRVGTEDNSQYQTFLRGLRNCGCNIRVCGLSATPYRTGEGSVTDGFFDSIPYEAKLSKLMDEGYLCPVRTPDTDSVDMSNVAVRRGDFVESQMQRVFLEDHNLILHVRGIVHHCRQRKSVLCFTSGVIHAERIAAMLEEATGDTVEMVVGDTPPLIREASLRRFREGKLKYLVNVMVLTEGYDAPDIDAVVTLRATTSPGLFYQMVGRGLRVGNKEDCLLLDYGGNTERHGYLDDEDYGVQEVPTPRDEPQERAEPQLRMCPACEALVAPRQIRCPNCQELMVDPSASLDDKPATNGVICRVATPFEVARWDMKTHLSSKGDQMLKVIYRMRGDVSKVHTEYLCLFHSGYAYNKYVEWWQMHTKLPLPNSMDEAIEDFNGGFLRMPEMLYLERQRGNNRFWNVVDRKFDSEIPDPVEQGATNNDLPF